VAAVSAADGKLAWRVEDKTLKKPYHYSIVLRPDAVYASAVYPSSWRLDYDTGEILGRFSTRWNCVRLTGSIDSLFNRGAWGAGTWRYDVATRRKEFISPMRPGCNDGVIVSNGLLYWGPWDCGACNISLYGHIALSHAPEASADDAPAGPRLETGPGSLTDLAPFDIRANDWPVYRENRPERSATGIAVAAQRTECWTFKPASGAEPTAPVCADDAVFVGDADGAVRCIDAQDGTLRWQVYTGGAVSFPPSLWDGRAYVGSADGWLYAFEAATGRLLWRFRAAPVERWIPVYGTLRSTWPVAGGVVARDGVVYAAAGIADFDGTHVYALDAVTGELKWHNGETGRLSKLSHCGVSLQGALYVDADKLCFAGGTVYDTAAFDLATGKCLNEPIRDARATKRTVFSSYYPRYAEQVSVLHDLADGRTIVGNRWGWQLACLAPAPPGAAPPEGGRKPSRETTWTKKGWSPAALIVGPDAILTISDKRADSTRSHALSALGFDDGGVLWTIPLPARAVRHGLAVDHAGRAVVSLRDGQIVCFTEGG